MEIYFDELPFKNLADQIQDFIPDDATCISVKINNVEYDPSSNSPFDWTPAYHSVYKYLTDSGVEILACTSGLHKNGKNGIPHVHYHFITQHYNPPANPSCHRKRWLGKKDNAEEYLNDATFKYEHLDPKLPKYQFLAYPMKEGILCHPSTYKYDGMKMNPETKRFLLGVGNEIYQKSLALKLRQDKLQERRQLAYQELIELVDDKPFGSFYELCDWLDENYLYKLEYEDIPDLKNYISNVRRIAVKKRLLRTRDI